MAKARAKTRELSARLSTTPVAIVGMASIFPQAENLPAYWDNILKKTDCIMDVPPSRWKIDDYYDPDPNAPDKTYCKRGGFIPDIDFDPMEFGLPPNILEVTDVSQLLGLVVARDALIDAGYENAPEELRDRTGVILGVVGMSTKLFTPLMARLQYPVWEKVLKSSGLSDEDTHRIIEKIKLAYVGWEENAFPGTIGNVIAGRIANRFDLGGTNCVTDAACASSLAAARMAIGELVEGHADMMLTGGVDTDNSIGTYLCFSKTPAFSHSNQVRPFDAESDGMMVGEGLGMLVLKRLEDAERDKDRIYAVIKGIGTSSDGRFKSIYAPRPAGQVKALQRAYEEAGFAPATAGLIEAHGTGTMAGDPAEFEGLREVFGNDNSNRQSIALGSVKSQIAHTKATAGAASLIKTALALYHKVLPPTLNVTQPNPKLKIEDTPFYLNTETRPWIRPAGGVPRRAGVSSFGFGGTNFHVVLEEYQAEHQEAYRVQPVPRTVLLSAPDPQQLEQHGRSVLAELQSERGKQRLAELEDEAQAASIPAGYARLGFVAATAEEAGNLLQAGMEWLRQKGEAGRWEHPQGIYYRRSAMEPAGKVVALFPGQGSQYLEMGRELAINFPPLRQVYGEVDGLFVEEGLKPLSSIVFPPPVFDAAAREAQEKKLQRTEHAQPAIGAFSAGLYKLVQRAGFRPDFAVGHSFGELTALWAAGVLDDGNFYRLAKARGQAMAAPQEPGFDSGAMLAVKGDVAQISAEVANLPGITLANQNSNQQVVLAGAKDAIANAQAVLGAKGYSVVLLPVSAAFHTSLVKHAQKPFAAALKGVDFQPAAVPVYSNVTGKQYPQDPQEARKLLAEHMLQPVLFKDEIENIYQQGGRVFVEIGPKNVLTNLVENILEGKPHLAVALNPNGKKDSDRQLRQAILQLRVAGMSLGAFDPYQAPARPAAAKKNKGLTVTLNGGYYITEKTRAAFEDALHDGHQVKPVSVSAPAALAASPSAQVMPSQPAALPPVPMSPAPGSTAPANSNGSSPLPSRPVVHSESVHPVDTALGEFQAHQDETLRVHEQYLRNEAEYGQVFARLAQMEMELLSRNGSAQQLESLRLMLESLERSMMRFHDHQAETARIHAQYLEHQRELSRAFVDLMPPHGAVAESEPPFSAPVTPPHTNGSATSSVATPRPAIDPQLDSLLSSVIPSPEAVAVPGNGRVHPVEHPQAPQQAVASPEAPGAAVGDPQALSRSLLEIVSEKTGYPVEMLELDMDMEADLGIDSIKRVEILGAMQTLYPDLPKVDPEALAEMRTLGQIGEYMSAGFAAAPASVPLAEPPTQPQVQAEVNMVGTPASVDVETLTRSLLEVVSEKTGYPVEMLELNMDMEADLGIDSIKRVEILGAMQTLYPDLPKVDPETLAELRTLGQIVEHMNTSASVAPLAAVAPEVVPESPAEPQPPAAVPATTGNVEEISKNFLSVVSEKTGYPVEMLELDMDMEADLGIDSIKRVEILGAMQTLYPDLPKVDPETLAELRTLGQVVDHLGQAPAAPTVAVSLPVMSPPTASGLPLSVAVLKDLPAPDVLDLSLPPNPLCLLTDDGTLTTAELAQALLKRGWKVAVLCFPAHVVPGTASLPERAALVTLSGLDEESIKQQFAALTADMGEVAAFVHLNPAVSSPNGAAVNFSEAQQAITRSVFLLAGQLKPMLDKVVPGGRSAFLTVTRLDGEFGLRPDSSFDPVAGGLSGLVKSLNLEWEAVFCRALDLNPALAPAEAARLILAEMDDPDRLLVEVGYPSPDRRVTLVAAPLEKVAQE
ncbi:MAG: acyltransferase domain-containing protein [Chloroflexi bacterium]|nr:acyltransferase domain-containing protein [Chloroflexota bacterium]